MGAKEKEDSRTMFGFPWTEKFRSAFRIMASELQNSGRGNSSDLARRALLELMTTYFGTERSSELNILEQWEDRIPEPKLLKFVLAKYTEREHIPSADASVTRADVAKQRQLEDLAEGKAKRRHTA